MTIVPTKVSLIGSAVAVVSLGAVLTLVHRPATTPAAYHSDNITSADITPSLTSLGLPQISVNGKEVPATNGTTTVPTSGGDATVTVSGNSAVVSTNDNDVDQTTSTPSGNVHVSVHTQSNGNANTHSSQNVSSHTSVSSGSNSDTSVSARGASHIEISTH